MERKINDLCDAMVSKCSDVIFITESIKKLSDTMQHNDTFFIWFGRPDTVCQAIYKLILAFILPQSSPHLINFNHLIL